MAIRYENIIKLGWRVVVAFCARTIVMFVSFFRDQANSSDKESEEESDIPLMVQDKDGTIYDIKDGKMDIIG